MSGLGMIWAQDITGVLGADGGMLWRVPADFAHFKATTCLLYTSPSPRDS